MKAAITLDSGSTATSGGGLLAHHRALTAPRLDIYQYFAGKTRAWGLFEDRLGTVRRQFRVDIHGSVVGERLLLEEDFVYDNGERTRRVWNIRRCGDDEYVGHANDLIGAARGRAVGNAINWRYRMKLPVGKQTWHVSFSDRMMLQSDGMLINRAKVSKFGFEIGSVTLSFQKIQAVNPMPRHPAAY